MKGRDISFVRRRRGIAQGPRGTYSSLQDRTISSQRATCQRPRVVLGLGIQLLGARTCLVRQTQARSCFDAGDTHTLGYQDKVRGTLSSSRQQAEPTKRSGDCGRANEGYRTPFQARPTGELPDHPRNLTGQTLAQSGEPAYAGGHLKPVRPRESFRLGISSASHPGKQDASRRLGFSWRAHVVDIEQGVSDVLRGRQRRVARRIPSRPPTGVFCDPLPPATSTEHDVGKSEARRVSRHGSSPGPTTSSRQLASPGQCVAFPTVYGAPFKSPRTRSRRCPCCPSSLAAAADLGPTPSAGWEGAEHVILTLRAPPCPPRWACRLRGRRCCCRIPWNSASSPVGRHSSTGIRSLLRRGAISTRGRGHTTAGAVSLPGREGALDGADGRSLLVFLAGWVTVAGRVPIGARMYFDPYSAECYCP